MLAALPSEAALRTLDPILNSAQVRTAIRNPRPEPRNREPENPKKETRNPKPTEKSETGTRNPEPET